MLEVCFGSFEREIIGNGLHKIDKTVFSYGNLELGKIEKEHFDEYRREYIDRYFSVGQRSEGEKIFKQEKEYFQKILQAAQRKEEIRIWVGTTPCSLCGYYHLIDSLKDTDPKIYTVILPKEASTRKNVKNADVSFGELKSEDIQKYLPLTQELSKKDICTISEKWKKLEKENADMRLNLCGEIKSVPLNFLDLEIIGYAPLKRYRMIEHIENCLNFCPHGLSDLFYTNRIDFLRNQGKI